jgi:pimeloyl-ACP methyl ester carboxylesterase
MTTYVLVHGAWGGAHSFRKLRPLLRAAGHEVFTPSLTGLGERAHLTSPQIDLSTHIADVVNTVVYEDLTDIVLLGYSYGGMVVTGAVDHLVGRVSHLVYLDAFVPEDAQSLDDLTGTHRRGPVIGLEAEWLIPATPRRSDDAASATWAARRRNPHPARCFAEPVRLAEPIESYPFTRTYIKATGEPRPERVTPFWTAADRAQASPAWRYREVATDHAIPDNRPEELTDLLVELA